MVRRWHGIRQVATAVCPGGGVQPRFSSRREQFLQAARCHSASALASKTPARCLSSFLAVPAGPWTAPEERPRMYCTENPTFVLRC